MKTFVIVHGAWSGAWEWERVVELLRGQGARVYVPTLSGLSERSHLKPDDIDLDTHISDIVNEILWKDLESVTLVAHSYGGYVATGALEKVREKVSAVVYLDAFIPKDGTSFSDLNPKWNEPGPIVAVPKFPPSPTMTKADQDWSAKKATPQPLKTLTGKVRVKGALDKIAKKTFIVCTGWDGPFTNVAAPLRKDPSWTVEEIKSGHDAPIEKPDELARMLIEASA